MAFDGTEGKEITLNEGAELTKNWRTDNPEASLGTFIGKDLIEKLLDQEGCMGIRVYYGKDGDSQMQPVFVGADADQNDMLGIVADQSWRTPPHGSVANALNS